ncbi:MAG TPA: hypothetical protein VGC60_03130 [Pyrinomonadaceae bacterium]
MRALLSLMFLTLALPGCQLAKSEPHTVDVATLIPPTTKPNFDTEIKPIFQARCQPCHFQGGKVYDKMPFDKAETIIRLGTKLFTRIKDEKERRLIREFLDQP